MREEGALVIPGAVGSWACSVLFWVVPESHLLSVHRGRGGGVPSIPGGGWGGGLWDSCPVGLQLLDLGRNSSTPTRPRARDAGEGYNRLVLWAPGPVPGQPPEIRPPRTAHSSRGAPQWRSAGEQGAPSLFRLRQAGSLLRAPWPPLTCVHLALERSLEVIHGSWPERSPFRSVTPPSSAPRASRLKLQRCPSCQSQS